MGVSSLLLIAVHSHPILGSRRGFPFFVYGWSNLTHPQRKHKTLSSNPSKGSPPLHVTACLSPPLPAEWMSLTKLLEKEETKNRGHTVVGLVVLRLLGCCDVIADARFGVTFWWFLRSSHLWLSPDVERTPHPEGVTVVPSQDCQCLAWHPHDRCSHILSCSVSWLESFYWACLDIWLTCDFLGWEVHTHMHGYVAVCLRRCSAYSLPSWGFLELPCSHRGGRHGRSRDPVGRAHMRPSAQIYCSDLEVSGQAKAKEHPLQKQRNSIQHGPGSSHFTITWSFFSDL